MIPKNSVKPLELVVSAIHCLREKNGSSPQKIVRYLEGKYNVDTEVLKPHVQIGLKRGISFGLITQKSGLYRLNDILSSPNASSYSDITSVSSQRQVRRQSKGPKKQKVRKLTGRKGGRKFAKHGKAVVEKHAKRTKMTKRRRKRARRNSRGRGFQNEIKRPRQKRQSSKGREPAKGRKRKKAKPEFRSMRIEQLEGQNPTVSNKEPEPPKT